LVLIDGVVPFKEIRSANGIVAKKEHSISVGFMHSFKRSLLAIPPARYVSVPESLIGNLKAGKQFGVIFQDAMDGF
jgi:hypothetical protein